MNDDIHALSGAYAVDALDDLERVRFEQHLALCAECRAEVASLRLAAAALSETASTPPPPELRARVLEGITRIRPLPPEVEARRPAPRHRAWWLAVAAAFAVAVGGSTFWQVTRDQGIQQPADAMVDRVRNAADAQRVTLDVGPVASATVIRSKALGKAVIETHAMPAAPTGKVYQLWLQTPAGEMKGAGLMPPRADQAVVLEGDAARAVGGGITVEPAGGSSVPTTTPIVVFSFPA